MKKILLIVTVNLLLFEIVSIGVIYTIGVIRPGLRSDLRIKKHISSITDADFQALRQNYDGLVGWDNKPSSTRDVENSADVMTTESFGPDGAREDSRQHDQVLIHTYGDSFTMCQEVDNDQTWQFFLEQSVSADVKNFGVNGYGATQMLLKAQRHFDEGVVAKYTMLVIYTDSLTRAVNNFRPFANWSTRGRLAFKPSHRRIEGEVRLIPMAFEDPSMSDEEIIALIWQLAETDYWMETRLYLEAAFPFSLQVAKASPGIAREALGKFGLGDEQVRLWDDPEGRAVMLHIIREFQSAAEAAGTIPIVVFMPRVHFWKNGRTPTPYHGFKAETLRANFPDLWVIDIAEAEFDEERFNVLPFSGHASEYGNRMIAGHVAKSLEQFGVPVPIGDSP